MCSWRVLFRKRRKAALHPIFRRFFGFFTADSLCQCPHNVSGCGHHGLETKKIFGIAIPETTDSRRDTLFSSQS